MAITDNERRAVYDVMAANGPDVDMWSTAFGRLVGRVKKTNINIEDSGAVYRVLDQMGMFGSKSDALRADGDKYF